MYSAALSNGTSTSLSFSSIHFCILAGACYYCLFKGKEFIVFHYKVNLYPYPDINKDDQIKGNEMDST